MEKVRTVSDTKRDFYAHHNRPINSVYRRVVEELMVEMHLLSVNTKFRPDPIYYLGVISSFERFMQGYRPEADKESILSALCQSVGGSLEQYRQGASQAFQLAKDLGSLEALVNWFESPTAQPGVEGLAEAVQEISNNPQFKYSRLFAIGLYTLIQEVSPDTLKNENSSQEVITKLTNALGLPPERLAKDFDLYRSNSEKMQQMIAVLEDVLEADRKKRQQKDKELPKSE